ncbi:MAG TPA: hypothetical protein DCS21_04415 [Gammaproteobacteria bacterium]|nr:hypothetical protein [Gammaproteobacteria bacterium]
MTAQTVVIIPNPDPDISQAERFLTWLDEDADFFTFQTFDDLATRGDKSLARIIHGTLDQHQIDLQRLQWRRAGVYVTVNETDRKGRRLANMVRPRCIFCEWDNAGTRLPAWPIEPHVINETSPGKYHCYWFSGDLEWADFDALMQVMVAWGSDKNARDRARVMRLPGFWHQKHETPFQVRMIAENERMPYSRQELLDAFPIQSAQPEPEAATVRPDKDHHQWMSVVVRLAGDAAAATWQDPKAGRNAQVMSLGHELASRGVPEDYDTDALRTFEKTMRPTNASGEVAGLNWDNEWAALKHGRRTALTGNKPTVAHGAAIADALLKGQDAKARAKAKKILVDRPELQPFPTALLDAPGLLGEYVAFTTATARMKQPILAIANGLAMLATAIGRTVRTETDVRTNIYTLGIAPSASGKDHSRKVAKKLLAAAGLSTRLGGENLASDTGLLDAMHRSPASLFQIDELGRILKTMTKSDKGHLYNIPTILMQLYSSADGLFLGKEYAGGERKDIEQPCACLYGTTVPSHFFAALTHDEAEDGFLGRFLIFMGDEEPPEQFPVMCDLPESLVTAIIDLSARPINVEPKGNIDAVQVPRPQVYRMDESAQAAFASFNAWVLGKRTDHRARKTGAIWGRAWELAAKVALIIAASRVPAPAVITESDAVYAIELVRWCAGNMASCIALYVAENEVESVNKRVERIIRESGAGGLSMTDLYGKTRFLKKRERSEVLEDLEAGGWVFSQTAAAAGNNPKGVRMLVHAAFAGSETA